MLIATNDFQEKIIKAFPDRGVIINKSLLGYSDQFHKLPNFVADFLISQLVDLNNPTEGLKKINDLLDKHFIESDKSEWVKSQIREKGFFVLIGRLQCRYDESRDEYWASISALGSQNVRIDPFLIAEFGDSLLTTGTWGSIQIVFDEGFAIRSKMYPFLVSGFRPMQIVSIDLESWITSREQFTDNEWIDLLVSSVGFDPKLLNEKEKIIYLTRLVPFIETNVNLCELGPPETGKTFMGQSLSSYGFVISGSKTTVASLFYDKLRHKPGIIGQQDVIFFDEISGAKWTGQDELINMLKDFMNSGRFGRGVVSFSSGCSIMFIGNIDCDRKKKCVSCRYRNLFSPFPHIISSDRAFLDRLHGFIPGWEVPQIRESHFAKDVGFMSDYLSEIMHRMRKKNYAPVITSRVDFGNMSQRNQRSLVRIGCGLLKLIYPHRAVETILGEELKRVLDVAVDLRERVLKQLAVISPNEFGGVCLSYEIKEMNDVN